MTERAAIDFEGPVAPWKQLTAILRQQIISGEIPPGRAIPSRTQLQQRYGMAPRTLAKVTDQLQAEGLIKPETGMGLFVQDHEHWQPSADV